MDKQDRKKSQREETQAKCQMDYTGIHGRPEEETEHTRRAQTEAVVRDGNWNARDSQCRASPRTRLGQVPVGDNCGQQRKQRAYSAACFDDIERAVREKQQVSLTHGVNTKGDQAACAQS